MVTAEQAGRLGQWGVVASVQPNFDALWGGERRHVCAAPWRRPRHAAEPVGAVSIPRRAPRVRLRHPGDRHESVVDGARGDSPPARPAARSRCVRRSRRRPAAGGAPAACATASPAPLCPVRPRRMRYGTPTSFEVSAPADAVQRWSTDPRSRVPALPRLGDDGCRGAGRPSIEVSSSMAERRASARDEAEDTLLVPERNPVQASDQSSQRHWSVPGCPHGCGDRRRTAAVPELSAVRLVVMPPSLAFALLAWVLTRETTTLVGGFGYGLLFGLAFYSHCCRGPANWWEWFPGWRFRSCRRCFPGLFGVLAVAVRRLPGWPFWFAALWVAQEWAQVDCAVRRISLGRRRIQSNQTAHCWPSRTSAGLRCCRSPSR